MKNVEVEPDFISVDEAELMIAEAPYDAEVLTPYIPAEEAPEAASTTDDESDHSEPGAMRPSQYRSLLRGFIRTVEAEGVPVTLSPDPDKPAVHADLALKRPTPAAPDFSNLFAEAPPVRREPMHFTQEQLATVFDQDAPAGETTREHAAVMAAAAPVVVEPKPTIRERIKQFRQDRREARRAKVPRPGLRRAVGAVATISLLVSGGIFAKASIPEASAQQEAAPVTTVVDAPKDTLANNSPTTAAPEATEQAGPQLTETQAKAVITIATGRYAFELAHPELTQVQVDQQFMAAVDYAAIVQNGNS